MGVHLEGAGKRLEREHNNLAWLAWHVAALPRAKRFPKLETMLSRPTQPKAQTWEQQFAIMGSWIASTKRPAKAR